MDRRRRTAGYRTARSDAVHPPDCRPQRRPVRSSTDPDHSQCRNRHLCALNRQESQKRLKRNTYRYRKFLALHCWAIRATWDLHSAKTESKSGVDSSPMVSGTSSCNDGSSPGSSTTASWGLNSLKKLDGMRGGRMKVHSCPNAVLLYENQGSVRHHE